MKGFPVHVECYFSLVRVWIENPVGQSDSDNHLVTITCLNDEEARTIAERWANTFGAGCWDENQKKILVEPRGTLWDEDFDEDDEE